MSTSKKGFEGTTKTLAQRKLEKKRLKGNLGHPLLVWTHHLHPKGINIDGFAQKPVAFKTQKMFLPGYEKVTNLFEPQSTRISSLRLLNQENTKVFLGLEG